MEFYIARATQVAAMDQNQVEKLHKRETGSGYCLTNSDIQTLFSLPATKEHWGIPEDTGLRANHTARIKKEIRDMGILKTEPNDLVQAGNLEAVHSFDWAVFHSNKQVFEYRGGKSGKGSLLDRVEKGVNRDVVGLLLVLSILAP